MNDGKNSRRKPTPQALGGLLVLGGILFLVQAGRTERFFDAVGSPGSMWWGRALGFIAISAGAILLLSAFVKADDN